MFPPGLLQTDSRVCAHAEEEHDRAIRGPDDPLHLPHKPPAPGLR